MSGQKRLSHSKQLEARYKAIFLIAVSLFVFSPFVGISSMIGIVGDTAIQIKIGLDGIAGHKLMLDEVYSWHEGLSWVAHEEGWYFLLGLMYKILGLAGVIAVGAVFNYMTAICSVMYFKDKAHPLISLAVIALTAKLAGFPDYNVRPSCSSAALIALLILLVITDRKPMATAGVFAVSSFVLAWLHGGILPVYFAVMGVFMVIELIYREYKTALIYAVSLPLGFVLSLLNPIGIGVWTFGFIQSGATDVWANVDEWLPMNFNILQIVLILVVFIGFMVKDDLKNFDKKAVTKIAILSMFLIMTCVYKRFVLLYSIAFLMFAPESLEALLVWLNKNTVKIKTESISLSKSSYQLLSIVCVIGLLASGVYYSKLYIRDNSMRDIEEMAAYDHEVIEFIKDKGYSRMFNTFDTGSWLVFYDIPVHIDNRIDPYMEEYSGVDHVRGKMNISTITELNVFCEEYSPDALLIPNCDPYLIHEIETYESVKYEVVYDTTVTSTMVDSISNRWVIIEYRQ